jgi:protein-S-isoprenylcysteine O-methyltransferase Ste14
MLLLADSASVASAVDLPLRGDLVSPQPAAYHASIVLPNKLSLLSFLADDKRATSIPGQRCITVPPANGNADVQAMASQLAAGAPADVAARPTLLRRLIHFLVGRRVAVSLVLFISLVLLDIFVIDNHPRDVLSWSDPLVVLSELLIFAGLALRSWAAGTLRKRRELATSGPYAWIRNPLYAGSLMMMVGFCTLVKDPQSIWIVIGPVAWLYWHAVRSEERHLARLFPDAWPAYAAAVPRFIPRRLIRPRASEWSLSQWLHNAEYQAWLGSAAAIVGIKLWQVWL